MARSSSTLKVVCALLILVAVAAPAAEGAITCAQVAGDIAPCIPYARSAGGPVPPACCSGIKALNSAAGTTPDRQAACKCLKGAATAISGINYGLVAGLPAKCGVKIPFKLSLSTNCDSVK